MSTASPEVIERWRSEAEKFYGDEYCTDKNTDPDQDSYYADQFLDLKVNSFIDGRQSAAIELPAPTECCGASRHYWPIPLKEHIESQGYRVEVKGG